MKTLEHLEGCGVAGEPGYRAGAYILRRGNARLAIIVSDGGGWDHVSVSLKTRCPTWDEMCWVKDVCFEHDEVVMQLHPAKSEYVNYHPFCLHLWRPQTAEEIAAIKLAWERDGEEYLDLGCSSPIPLPPSYFVGPKPRELVT